MSLMVDKVHAASQHPKADRPKNQFPPAWPSIAWLHIYDKLRLTEQKATVQSLSNLNCLVFEFNDRGLADEYKETDWAFERAIGTIM